MMNTTNTTTDTRAALTVAVEPVRVTLKTIDELTEAIGKLDAGITTGENEVKRLEVAALDDSDAAQKLPGVQVRLDLQQKQKATLEAKLSAPVRSLRELLQTLPDPMRAFLNPTMEELRRKLDGELTVHIPDPGIRQQAVNGHATVHRLRNVMSCYWQVFQATEHPAETARQVLAEISTILAGQKPWLTEP